MAGNRSFGQKMQYFSTCSSLYGWEINKLSCQYNYFTPASMWIFVRKRSKHNTIPTHPQLSDTSTTLPTATLSVHLCHRNTPELSDFGFYLKSARKLNCFVAWYKTNKATDICFGTLQPSNWKKIWTLHIMKQSTVKWLDKFYKSEFKHFFQYLNFCNKTNKCSLIKCV